MKTQLSTRHLFRVILCILILGCRVRAEESFFEDFGDGDIKDDSPVTWGWDANKGQCVLTPQGLQPKPARTGYSMPGSHLYAYAHKDGADVQATGTLRIRAQLNIGSGRNACGLVCLRTSQSTGYGFKIAGGGYTFGHLNGYHNPAWGSPNNGRYDPREDVIVQLDAVDITDTQGERTTRLECRVWLPGQEMPTDPDIVVTDDAYASGGIAIGTSTDVLNAPSPTTFRWVEVTIRQVEPIVDFNGNGTVDIKDLVKLIECWGQDESAYDIVADGVVDVNDLEVLMDYWQQDANDPSLLACWKCDETEGNIAYDSAAASDAVVMGDALWLSDDGHVDGALLCDGIDDYVTTDFVLNPVGGPFSVFAWVQGGAPGQVILSQAEGMDWLMTDPEQGRLMTNLTEPTKNIRGKIKAGPSLMSSSIITDGQWHRVGLTWDGENRVLYADDVVVAHDTIENLASCKGTLSIGAGSELEPDSLWSGMIDDVRIYNRVVVP